MKQRVFIFFYLLILIIQTINAQSPQYRHYTAGDGLPSATVYGIIQDKKDYMWFGTENGVSRFDGKTFQTFTLQDGLTDNIVLNLFEDHLGRIWFLTLNGNFCFYKNGKIYNSVNDPLLAKLPNMGIVYSSLEDDEGNIFFDALNGVLKITDSVFFVLPAFPEPVKDNIQKISNTVYRNLMLRILFKPGPPYYFYINEGMFRYQGKVQRLISSEKMPLIVRSVFQKQIQEDFWICTFDHGIIQVKDFKKPNPAYKKYLPDIQISRVFDDREGNLWFSTSDQGVFLIPRDLKKVVHYRKSDGLPQENIKVLLKDKENTIWAGSVKNNLYRLKEGALREFKLKSSIPGLVTPVYDICEDQSGNIFVATIPDLTLFSKKPFGVDGKVLKIELPTMKRMAWYGNYKSLSVDKHGNLLATSHKQLFFYNQHNSLGKRNLMSVKTPPNNTRIYTAAIDDKGGIWVANNEGLNKYQGDTLAGYYQQDSLLKEPISQIEVIPDGNLILSTRSKGVILFDGNKVLQRFSEKDGLPSDISNKIYMEKNKVWIATSKGVSQLFYHNGKLILGRNYTMDDGLLSNEINDVITIGDTIYVATAEGLSVLLEGKPVTSTSPSLFITTAQYGEENIFNTKDAVLTYGNKYLNIGFIAITYQQPQKVQYMYRLRGADDSWKLNTSGSVDYPALMPGDYIFEVKAKKINSEWTEAKQLSFSIDAPFWMQNWFYIIIYSIGFTGIISLIYFFIRQKKTAQLKKRELQNHMVHLEQQALSALMNPHFIFNALNSIQEYLHKNDKLSANKYLSLFARLTRKNMEAVMKNAVSLEDELERLKLYLNFEKLRFGEKLKYEIIIPEEMEIDELLLPPMVLQPFVENAIWHGLMPLAEGGQILISAKMLNESNYQVLIRDTGIGIDSSKEIKQGQELTHNSKGMKLTSERLELWTRNIGGKFELQIEQIQATSSSKGGTLVTITLPAQTSGNR